MLSSFKEDHVVLDINGAGHYVGTYIAWTALERYWCGEGDYKFHIDDTDYPTICGTGIEDYVCGVWGFYEKKDYGVLYRHETTYCTPYMEYLYYSCVSGIKEIYGYDGMPVHGLYRWHIVDPICLKRG